MKARKPQRRFAHRARFWKDDEGLALTEYLVLLGLLTGAVITAVLAIGGSVENSWSGWADWYDETLAELSTPDMGNAGASGDETPSGPDAVQSTPSAPPEQSSGENLESEPEAEDDDDDGKTNNGKAKAWGKPASK